MGKKLFKGGNKLKKNMLNDLTTIEINKTSECALNIPDTICFNKKQQEEILEKADMPSTNTFNIDEIKKKFDCSTQKCIANRTRLTNSDSLFKISGPYNNTNLLSNVDIDSVMEQYSKKFTFFKNFDFTMDDWINPSYSDKDVVKLAKVPGFICDLIKGGKTCVGFIMNTDTWSGGGLHWMSMFCDFRNNKAWTVEFFNSSGNKPSHNIQLLMDLIVSNLNECNAKPIDCKVIQHVIVKKPHQISETECGLYSLFMIYNRCRNIPIEYFEHNEYAKIPDETMMEFRKYIFYND